MAAPRPAASITRDYVANSGIDIKFGDFNNDGTIDRFLFGNRFLTLFLLDTNGAYRVPTSYAQNSKPSRIRAADVTGDGNADPLNLNFGRTMNVLKNNGAGTFTVLTPFNVLSFKQWFELNDVNEDGTLDIVTLSGTGACVSPERVQELSGLAGRLRSQPVHRWKSWCLETSTAMAMGPSMVESARLIVRSLTSTVMAGST